MAAAIDTADIRARHPEVFKPPLLKRFLAPAITLGTILYLCFVWWLFSVGTVFTNGNWDIAGAYLADWVSYEVRPDIEYDGDYLNVEFSRFSPLGENPDPEWLTTTVETVQRTVSQAADTSVPTVAEKVENSFMAPAAKGTFVAPDGSASASFMAPGAPLGGNDAPGAGAGEGSETITEDVVTEAHIRIGGAAIEVVPGLVTVNYEGQTLIVDVVSQQSVDVRGPLPAWASQREPGGDIQMRFGFPGSIEIEDDEIKIRNRFFGWENFWFDTRSPYWDMSFSQVVSTIFVGERIDPDRSNLSLAWNNFVYNAEWQHGDVWIKLLQTIVMAFVGTLFASALAFPLSFMAARNITPNRVLNQLLKRGFDFLRCVDMLIWALFFTRAFGPGPLAGMSAIFFTDTGTLGKLYSEALENIDDKQREGIRSVGAAPVLIQRYGVVPQVLPVFASQSLYFWESNTRSATIIGAVGAGGIGLKLWEAMRTNSDWENVAYMVILILLTVFVFDTVSNVIRSRLINRSN